MPSKPMAKFKTPERIRTLDELTATTIAHLKLHPGLDVPRLQRKLGFTPDRQFKEGAPSTNARKAINRLVKAGVIRIEPPSKIYPTPRAFLCEGANQTANHLEAS